MHPHGQTTVISVVPTPSETVEPHGARCSFRRLLKKKSHTNGSMVSTASRRVRPRRAAHSMHRFHHGETRCASVRAWGTFKAPTGNRAHQLWNGQRHRR